MIRQLATCRWIAEHHNVLITGATGVGKTYLACALGQQACRQGHRVIYRRLPRLFAELALAHADGSYITLLARLARVDVLVLDDWGLGAVTDRHRHDLLEILEDRDGTRSTVITSQLPRDRWHDYLGDPTVADAILDRLVHRGRTARARRAVATQDGAAARSSRRRTEARPWTPPDPWTPQNGVHRSLENRTERGFPQRPPPSSMRCTGRRDEEPTRVACQEAEDSLHCRTPSVASLRSRCVVSTDHDGVD